MVIYTLPGPVYNYTVTIPEFVPDVLDFNVKVSNSAKKPGNSNLPAGTATVLLTVNSVRGLRNVNLSITPSDSDLGSATIAPVSEHISGSVVANSFVLTAPYLERGETALITLNYSRCSTGAADVTFMLTADELNSPVCTRLVV